MTADPVMVEILRGGQVESRHRGRAVVVDAAGHRIAAWGAIEAPCFPRSAIKFLQALPLVETGAADAFDLGDRELALACASHGGEHAHVEAVAAWLARLGLSEKDLECGAHAPSYAPAAAELVRRGEAPSALHNNCSGKHAGFLTTARHLGEPLADYAGFDHPVQARIRATLAEMGEVRPVALTEHYGIDGCSIPTYAVPLVALALSMARFATPAALAPERARAVRRLSRAIAAQPFMIAGTGRLCTAANGAAQGRLLLKTGAEGVFMGALPARGLGFALKVEDGATRASEVACVALLDHVAGMDPELAAALEPWRAPILRNWRGLAVGEIRALPLPA